ncbi:MAG: zinc ribbon domain-containing protein [Actinomycetota bacterium]
MPATVEPAVLERLLELQAEDSAIRRLHERRASLPEAARLAEVNDQLAELNADVEIATKQHDEIAREQDRLEGEIELVEQKIAREEERMYSGGVSNPKELSALQAEVASLKKKKSSIEDELIEVMDQREHASSTLESLTQERTTASGEADQLNQQVTTLTGDIEVELQKHESARADIVPDIPADLLSMYDKLREQKAGVGAARLESGTCQGCHTKLPAKEVERMRAEGGLQRCDNCRRILVV